MQVNYQVQRGWYNYLCKSNYQVQRGWDNYLCKSITKYKEDDINIYASKLPSTKRMI